MTTAVLNSAYHSYICTYVWGYVHASLFVMIRVWQKYVNTQFMCIERNSYKYEFFRLVSEPGLTGLLPRWTGRVRTKSPRSLFLMMRPLLVNDGLLSTDVTTLCLNNLYCSKNYIFIFLTRFSCRIYYELVLKYKHYSKAMT